MIPIDLQAGLKTRLEAEFANRTFKNPNNQDVPLNVFEQHLPQKKKEDLSLYPYVIIQLSEGTQVTEVSSEDIKIMFIIGIYDIDSSNQGYREVTRIINRITTNLTLNPLVNRKFEMNYPIKWTIYEEDVAPYFFGGIETTWAVSTFSRQDVEELI
ncbi:hypothetical protein [Bacillus sp. ISL-57]|uniref:hypothetical protein n=1 Tax=Bacillus sp. ISL-57 TaxID=2819135 RepID=UPI001BECB62C|nr:hypothetical protein [Bacillus sp. ISL-57]MBT2717548.1 hypothetical protein [Bacillus sp. ISL-57]